MPILQAFHVKLYWGARVDRFVTVGRGKVIELSGWLVIEISRYIEGREKNRELPDRVQS